MMLPHTATRYTRSTAADSEGMRAVTFVSAGTFQCHYQPRSLTPEEIVNYGLSDYQGEAKLIFFRTGSTLIVLDGVKIGSDKYEVRAVNTWDNHKEAVLVPSEGTMS